MNFASLAALVLALFLARAEAVQPEQITYASYLDFAAGTPRSVTLSDLGVLAPGPAVAETASLPPLEAEQIWALLPVDGALYAATSPKGELFRISAAGKAEVAAKFTETHLYALAKNDRQEIFVGTSPGGKIYRLGKGGKPEVYFDPKSKYIWALAFDKKGELYAATGMEGKIFKITAQGKGSVFYASDEVHIRSLAFDRQGNLLAGSAGTGLLYRIAPDGAAVVLASTGRDEVNHIVVASDGTLYFSANGSPHMNGGIHEMNGPRDGLPSLSLGDGKPLLIGSILPKPTFAGGQLDEGNGASQVWRIDSSLYPQAVWSTPDAILTLDLDGDGVRVGTAGEGAFYHLDPRGHATEILKLDGPVPTATAGDSVAASNPAKLYRIGGTRAVRDPGVYESDVVDSRGFARWGALRAEGTDPAFELFTRSGNTPHPDKSWYPWVPVRNDRSVSPPARYFQFKIELSAGTIDHVEFSFLPKNLPPKIAQVEILNPGVGYITVEAPQQPNQNKTAEQILLAAVSGTEEEGGMPANQTIHYQQVASRGFRTVVWKASDPNHDTLRYTLYYRSAADSPYPEWRQLAKDIDGTVFSWDASGWPDGRYYLKVVASDEKDNPPGEALTDEMVSRLFLVDNTPPVIDVQSGASRHVDFEVTKQVTGIDSVSVSTNGSDFKDLQPADGILDPRRQRFSYKLEAGEVLFIRAEDQAGNVSSTLVKPK